MGARDVRNAVTAEQLDKLYTEHSAAVFSTALRITGCRSAAEDIMQDIFLRLQDGPPVRTIGCLRQWFRGAATRRSLMYLRTSRRRREVRIEPAMEYVEKSRTSGVVDTIALDRAVARLSAALRVVFVLHHVEGMTHKEIAEELGITTAASAKRLSRAVESLRHQLGGP